MKALSEVGALDTRLCARLSLASRARGCDGSDSSAFAGIVSSEDRGVETDSLLAVIAGRAATELRRAVDLDAIHAAAVIDLVAADTVGKALDRSISYFEMLTRLAPRDPSPFVDLAAAHLAAAARGRDASHLLDALDASSRALEIEDHNNAARFDRALSFDLLGLDREAAREWRRYLDVDSTSDWAARGRKRLATIASRKANSVPDTLASSDSLVAFVTRAPFEARGFAWEVLLGGWASAIQHDNSARARERLGAAGVIADALVRRFADLSLRNAVDDVRRASTGTARELARLHARYARGLERTREHDHRAADSAYLEVMSDENAPTTLRAWATHGHANSLVYAGALLDAIRLEESLLRTFDNDRHPSLAGRARWLVGIGYLRLGRNQEGLAEIGRARQFFDRAGERENVYATMGVEGEVAFRSGDDELGFANTLNALRGLRDYPTSTWRHNMLYVLGGQASVRARQHAALAIEDEDLASEQAAGRPTTAAESQLARARTLWTSGETDRAQQAMDRALTAIAALPADAHGQLSAELNLARASGLLRSDPMRARTLLDSVVAFYTPTRNAIKLIPALVTRARASIALGLTEPAEADLSRAAELFTVQQKAVTAPAQRVALFREARAVFDGLVSLRASRGRARDALAALEQGRAILGGSSLPAFSFSLPEGRRRRDVAVEYSLIGDTLLTWMVDSLGVDLFRSTIPRQDFAAVTERMRAALELGTTESAQPELARLYDWFVRPVENRLGQSGAAITIVGDRDVSAIPFAALYDRRRRRFLVEVHPVRWATSVANGDHAARSTPVDSVPAVFVGDPAPSDRASTFFPRLTGAASETRSAAALYVHSTTLLGKAADSASVIRSLSGAELFHFAGHAVFDDARPERSRLVLRPRDLEAKAIAALDLRRLRVVVLSACETMRAPEGASGGFMGLTDAFLAAGAGGVVGSLWRVSDRPTAELMLAFHRSFKASGDATEALASAQIALLHSSNEALRSPSAWGAFRYAGH